MDDDEIRRRMIELRKQVEALSKGELIDTGKELVRQRDVILEEIEQLLNQLPE